MFTKRIISNYVPPSPDDLGRLKGELRFTGQQMAELAGVANNNQWRKYTGGENPRSLNPHILFFIAAQLALDTYQFETVLLKMKELGGQFSYDLINEDDD